MKTKILNSVNKAHISSRSHKDHFPTVEISSPTDIFYFSADFCGDCGLLDCDIMYSYINVSQECTTSTFSVDGVTVRLYRQITEGVVNQISGKGRGDRTWSGPTATANRKYILSLFPLSQI
jgi:hypothetical protein